MLKLNLKLLAALATAALLATGCTGSDDNPDQPDQQETPQPMTGQVLLNGQTVKSPLYEVKPGSYKLPLVSVMQVVAPPPFTTPYVTKPLGELLANTKDAGLLVAEGNSRQSAKIEERALRTTLQNIRERKPLNILLGRQYALHAESYDGILSGAPDLTAQNFVEFENSIAYIERNSGRHEVVLLTVRPITKLEMDERGLKLKTFGVSTDGVIWVEPFSGRFEPMEPFSFMWTARRFSGSCGDGPSTMCLYKWPQGGASAFHQHQQVALVALLNVLEFEYHRTEPWSKVEGSILTATTSGGNEIVIGTSNRQFVDDPKPVSQRLQELLRYGGKVMDAKAIHELPAFALKS